MIQSTLAATNFFGLLDNPNAFLAFWILFGAALGLHARKLSMVGYGGILTLTYISLQTDRWIFDGLLYLILIIVILWVASPVISSFMSNDAGGIDG